MSKTLNMVGGGAKGLFASIGVYVPNSTYSVKATYQDHAVDEKTIVGKLAQKPNPAHVVPDGYTQLEYIESTGTQYIDTEYIPNPNTTMEAELLMSGTFKNVEDYGGANSIFGVSNGTSQYSMNFGSGADQGNNVYTWLNKSYESGARIEDLVITDTIRTNRNKLVVGKGSISWGTASRSVTAKTTTQTTSLVLFGMKNDGVISAITSYNMRVFSWKIKENETIVRDFIPAKRLSDNAIGLYDKAENKFYANAGTGTFTAGSEIPQTIEYFLIDKITDLGTWKVIATDGEQTVTKDVLVDAAIEYEIAMSYYTYLYNLGDECEDITGGWVSGRYISDYGNVYGTAVKGDTTLRVYGSNLTSEAFFTANKINTINYSTLVINVVDGGDASSSSASVATMSSTGKELSNELKIAIANGENRIDISELNDMYYIGFGGWGYYYDFTVNKVWLE